MTIAERIKAERESQGLPPTINDPTVLTTLAKLLKEVGR